MTHLTKAIEATEKLQSFYARNGFKMPYALVNELLPALKAAQVEVEALSKEAAEYRELTQSPWPEVPVILYGERK